MPEFNRGGSKRSDEEMFMDQLLQSNPFVGVGTRMYPIAGARCVWGVSNDDLASVFLLSFVRVGDASWRFERQTLLLHRCLEVPPCAEA